MYTSYHIISYIKHILNTDVNVFTHVRVHPPLGSNAYILPSSMFLHMYSLTVSLTILDPSSNHSTSLPKLRMAYRRVFATLKTFVAVSVASCGTSSFATSGHQIRSLLLSSEMATTRNSELQRAKVVSCSSSTSPSFS